MLTPMELKKSSAERYLTGCVPVPALVWVKVTKPVSSLRKSKVTSMDAARAMY